jgi:hypothetical protein
MRNMIYEAVIALDALDIESKPNIRRAKTLSKRKQTAHLRSAVALTQACKEIRIEFHPIYLRSRKVAVTSGLLNDWLAAVYPTDADAKCGPSALTVQLPANTVIGGTLPRDFDMLPLLRMRHLSHDKMEKGRFNFDCPDADVIGWDGSFPDTNDEDWEPVGSMIAWMECFVLQDFLLFEGAGWKADVLGGKLRHVHFRRWHGTPIIYVLFKRSVAPQYINKFYAEEHEVARYLKESGLENTRAFFDFEVGAFFDFDVGASGALSISRNTTT